VVSLRGDIGRTVGLVSFPGEDFGAKKMAVVTAAELGVPTQAIKLREDISLPGNRMQIIG
jgi:hypothetical protein